MLEFYTSISDTSISSSNLRAEAYVPDKLEDQVTNNTIEFLSNRNKGSSISSGNLFLSNIYSLYIEDFRNTTTAPSNFPNLSSYLLKYTNNSQNMDIYKNILANQDKINKGNFNIINYNWKLNGDTSSLCSVNRLCVSSFQFVILFITIAIIAAVIVTVYVCYLKRKQYKEVK